ARQTVRQTIQLAEAAKEGLSIFEYAPASIGALDLYALCWELFELSPEKVKTNVKALTSRTEIAGSVSAGSPAAMAGTTDAAGTTGTAETREPELASLGGGASG